MEDANGAGFFSILFVRNGEENPVSIATFTVKKLPNLDIKMLACPRSRATLWHLC